MDLKDLSHYLGRCVNIFQTGKEDWVNLCTSYGIHIILMSLYVCTRNMYIRFLILLTVMLLIKMQIITIVAKVIFCLFFYFFFKNFVTLTNLSKFSNLVKNVHSLP